MKKSITAPMVVALIVLGIAGVLNWDVIRDTIQRTERTRVLDNEILRAMNESLVKSVFYDMDYDQVKRLEMDGAEIVTEVS